MDARPHPLISTSICCAKEGLMVQWAALESSSAYCLSLLGHSFAFSWIYPDGSQLPTSLAVSWGQLLSQGRQL